MTRENEEAKYLPGYGAVPSSPPLQHPVLQFFTQSVNAAICFVERIFTAARWLIGKAGQEGWRPAYCWAAGAINAYALYVAYVWLPLRGIIMEEHFYYAANFSTILILGAMGLRGAEKALKDGALEDIKAFFSRSPG